MLHELNINMSISPSIIKHFQRKKGISRACITLWSLILLYTLHTEPQCLIDLFSALAESSKNLITKLKIQQINFSDPVKSSAVNHLFITVMHVIS